MTCRMLSSYSNHSPNPMKNILKLLTCLQLCGTAWLYGLSSEIDKFIKLDGRVRVENYDDMWLQVSIPFRTIAHPDAVSAQGRTNRDPDKVFNDEFLDGLKIRTTLCFRNEFKRKAMKGSRTDPSFFEYFSADVEFLALKVENVTKRARFLFPKAIAEKNDFGAYPEQQMLGYVIEFSRNGQVFEVSESILFDKYDAEEVLEKFRQEALSKSSENNGILLPGHLISFDLLAGLGPVVLD